MTKLRYVPLISLGLIAIAVAYFLAISDQPRMADWRLEGNEIQAPEMVLVLGVPLSIFATMAIGVTRAVRAGSWFWLLCCIFVWPLSFVYTLLVNREDVA